MSSAFHRHEQKTNAYRPSAARGCEKPQKFVFPERAVRTTPETPVLSPPPPSPVWPLTPDLLPCKPAIARSEPTVIAAANTTQLDTTAVRGQRRGPRPSRQCSKRPPPPPQSTKPKPQDYHDYGNVLPRTTDTRSYPQCADPRTDAGQAYENYICTNSPRTEAGQKNARLTEGLAVSNRLYDDAESDQYSRQHVLRGLAVENLLYGDVEESDQYPRPNGVSPDQSETFYEDTQFSETWDDTFDETTGLTQSQSPQDAIYAPDWATPNVEPTIMQPLPSLATRKRNVPAALHISSASRSQTLSSVQGSLGPGAEAGQALPYDLYIASQKVLELTEDNFQTFVTNKDLAMVMFYDPFDQNSIVPKEHFKKAAETRKHGSQQFAAVNCQREPDFCASLGVNTLPMFKFYSWGKVLGTIRETTMFDYKSMTQYLDTLGDMGESGKTSKNPLHHLLPDIKHAKCIMAKKLGFKK